MKRYTFLFGILLLVAILLWFFVLRGQDPKDTHPGDTAGVELVSHAYKDGDAKRWRRETVEEISKLRAMTTADLKKTLEKYRAYGDEKGVEGIESLMIAGVGELSTRGDDGWLAARHYLRSLRDIDLTVSNAPARPNAYAPIVRPYHKVAYYLPNSVLRSILQHQSATLAVDPDAGFDGDLCSEEEIAQFEVNWGADKAEILRQACAGAFAGAPGGGTGLGPTAGISTMACLVSTREPTRAERLTGLMQDCLTSQSEGAGNPIADTMTCTGPTDQCVYPLRDAPHKTELRETADVDPENTTGAEGRLLERSHYTDPTESVRVMKDVFNENGSVERTYYNYGGVAALKTYTNEDGGMTHAEAIENGKVTESVTFNDDGGYTVVRYDEDGNETSRQRYDEDANPVDDETDDSSDTTSASFDEWGSTPECKALNLALYEDRLQGDLEEGGIVRPAEINPNPDDIGNYEEPADFACLGLGDLAIDSAMSCSQIAMCPGTAIVREDCGCGGVDTAFTPSRACGYAYMCADGLPAKEVNGQCACQNSDGPEYADPWTGGGPSPDPVARDQFIPD